jgi:hypothetical protein
MYRINLSIKIQNIFFGLIYSIQANGQISKTYFSLFYIYLQKEKNLP